MALPSNYKQLEWIESTGTQYINTGLNTSTKRKIEIGLSATSTNRYNIYGSGGGDQSSQITYSIRVGSSSYPKFAFLSRSNSPGTAITDVVADTNKHDIMLDIKNAIGTIDGVDYTLYQNTGTTSYSEYVFAYSRVGTVDNNYSFVGRIYYAKYYEDDILVRDFIPVKNLDTNTIGLYDLINDVFYTNAGTGTFNYPWEISAEINPSGAGTISGIGFYANGDTATIQAIPNQGYLFKNWILDGYTKLDWIEGTGTQFINTGVAYPSGKLLKVDIDISSTDTPSGTYKTALGMYTASSNGTPFSIWTYSGYGTTKFRDPVNNADYAFTFDGSRQNIVFQNFSRTGTANNLFLFKANPTGGNTYGGLSEMKIYSCKVSIDSEIIRNYIPVIRHSDGAIGLLNLVNFKFYGNSGTGTFIGGDIYAS